MKLCFFTNSLHRWSIEKCFEKAAEFGYDAVELCGIRPHCSPDDVGPEDLQHIKDLSKKYGLPIVSFEPEMPYFTWNKEEWNREGIDYFKKCLDICKELEIPMIVTAAQQCSYETTTDEDWDRWITALKELAAYTEEIDGPILILETVTPWEGSILIRSDDVVRSMKAVPSPKVKAMLDLAAPLTVGEPASNYFDRLGKDILHIHCVDCNKDNEDHLIIGDGEIPMVEQLQMLDSYGYDGYLSVELFDEYRTEPILYMNKAAKEIRAALEAGGIE